MQIPFSAVLAIQNNRPTENDRNTKTERTRDKKKFCFFWGENQIQLIFQSDVMDSQSTSQHVHTHIYIYLSLLYSISILSAINGQPDQNNKKKKLLFSLPVVCVCRGGDVQCMCCVSHWVAERAQPAPKRKGKKNEEE